MESCLLNYFILNKEVKSTCDFNPFLFEQGNGVYEIVRITDQKPLFLEEHIERFFQSLKLAEIQSGLSSKQIRSRLKALIEINQLKNGNIRFQHLAHPQNDNLFFAWITPTFYPSENDFKTGVKLLSLIAERKNPNAKRDNLPVREQANKLIQQNDVFEVLLINKDGFVTEGSRSNIFFVEGEKIITPPISEVLPGVTRSKIIGIAKENKVVLIEYPVHFEDVGSFDSVFLSGTSIKILPVNQIDNLNFAPKNPVITKVQQLYAELSTHYLNGFSW
ncbi:MAG: hypothetical protein DRI89_12545 [Bacteroidetes bacterium]|nr:MAG: hypothetical protein DRI89_12545 [Bacteroidota bacterium]